MTDPARPDEKGRTTYPANADGDGHSSNYDEGRRLLFSADEDFCKTSGSGTEKGFGYLRVWDYATWARRGRSARYKTANASGSKDQRRATTRSTTRCSSGSTSTSPGTRTASASWTRATRGSARGRVFVPPAVNNPIQPSQRGTLTNATQVWGVAYDESRDLVYASDMNSGLWILRRTN